MIKPEKSPKFSKKYTKFSRIILEKPKKLPMRLAQLDGESRLRRQMGFA